MNVNEVLEIFKEFKDILLENVVILDTDLQRLNTIKKYILKTQEQEKVLSIIKEKEVYIHSLRDSEILSHYNNRVYIPYKHKLTQEEFELLKRWIGHEN